MVASTPSQYDVGSVKSQHCFNRFIRSSLVGLCIGSLLLILFSFVVMVSIISFMVASGVFRSSGGLSGFFVKLYFSPIFPRKHLMVVVLNDMSSPDLLCCEA